MYLYYYAPRHCITIVVVVTTVAAMGVRLLQIVFDNETVTFGPGQTIAGRVTVVTSDSVKIRCLQLKFKGVARNNVFVKNHGRGREELFAKTLTLVNYMDKSQSLEDGKHDYPFIFSLPHQLPSSFDNKHGHIRYSAKSRIFTFCGRDEGTKKIFQVYSPVNLNDEVLKDLTEPKTVQKQHAYNYCLCSSGLLTIIMYVPWTGYIPGQNIPLTIELHNDSNWQIHAIQIKLERELLFKTKGYKKSYLSELSSSFVQGIGARVSASCTKQITIPNNLIINNLNYCGIIAEHFILKVRTLVDGFNQNTEAKMEIKIGNVPLVT